MLCPALIQANVAKLIGKHFTVEMDDDPKHMAKASQKRQINCIFLNGSVT